MNTKYNKVLIIHYDPDFAELILELLRKFKVEITLATNLSEGENILKRVTFGLVVIECPVVMDTETLSRFILQTNITKTQIFLVAKEKRFLAGLGGQSNVSIFDQGNISAQIASSIENINK